jgi:multicomponent Na+:H+ antiporter subunit C
MTTGLLLALAGTVVVALGLYAVVAQAHLLRKILGLNLLGSGVFLVLVGGAQASAGAAPDPVPQALVLTGIVVTVAVTALAVTLVRRLAAETGARSLPEDSDE